MNYPTAIVVVGGGVTGWLAALMLGRGPRPKGVPAPRITVVDTPQAGPGPVAEGTTAAFRQMLRAFDIDELAFLRETGGTLRVGTRHRDWRKIGHRYDAPIDDPRRIAQADLDTFQVAAGKSVAEPHMFAHLMAARRAPWSRSKGRLVAAGPFHHAYHVDPTRVGGFLRRQVTGARLVGAAVSGVETGPEGIAAVVLDGGERLTADLYLDCTGSDRALIGHLDARWDDFGADLPADRVLRFRVEPAAGEEIAPYTETRALGSGWMWRIPTRGGIGCGYVHSGAHASPEAAQAEVEAALGFAVVSGEMAALEAGRLREAWIGNCIALGAASSVLEPLEPTAMHGSIVQLMLLSEWLGRPDARADYNSAVAGQVDDFRNFIRLHYVSERRDTPFWRDIADSHPAAVAGRLVEWDGKVPRTSDFEAFAEGLPHVDETLHVPVLDGLGLLSRDRARKRMDGDPQGRKRAKIARDRLVADYTRTASLCLPHRAFLDSLGEEEAP